MRNTIHLLSEETIDKIAAGEVVETPASVVKELVENALDAQATSITITIESGGLQQIQVSDDGCGMEQDDVRLAIRRHSTSKLQQVEDLQRIATFGFRGEALASIAAISQLTLISASNQDIGTKIVVKGGEVYRIEEHPRARGTTVEVQTLFFNVPARRKAQKSSRALTQEVRSLIGKFALANPSIAFQLLATETTEIPARPHLPPFEQLQLRIGDVLGSALSEQLLPLQWQEQQIELRGMISPPTLSRPSRRGQHLFINRRILEYPLLSFVIKEAYSTALPAQRHPLYVLHLQLPSQMIDPNVHPQKSRVRIQEEHSLRRVIHTAVQRALGAQQETPLPLVAAPLIAHDSGGAALQQIGPEAFVSAPQQDLPLPAALRAIGSYGHYLLLDASTLPPPLPARCGMLLLHLRRAQMRICYQQIIAPPASSGRQEMLFPVPIAISPEESMAFDGCQQQLAQIGFALRAFGKGSLLVEATPSGIASQQLADIIHALLAEAETPLYKKSSQQQRRERLARRASQLASGAKNAFSVAEGLTILQQLLRCQEIYICPFGQATLTTLNSDDLEQLFDKKGSKPLPAAPAAAASRH